MTYSNTGFSAHPLANPFSCRMCGNHNMVGFGYGRTSSVRLDSKANLPEAKPYQPSHDLEVLNQLGAELGCSRLDVVGMSQMFLGFVACPDGTMIDFKTGKVIVDPNRGCQNGEWAKLRCISPSYSSGAEESWNAPQRSSSTALNARDSEKYWRDQAAAEKAKQMEMSDLQKKMLADLESGSLMKLSKLELVDESLKSKAEESAVDDRGEADGQDIHSSN